MSNFESRGSGHPVDGYVDPNFPNPHGEGDVSIIIYGYTPALSLAVFAAVWFSLLFVAHLAQTVRYRSWWFVTFPIGLIFEVVGYIARSLSAEKDPYRLTFFILNYFFIVTAPVFLAAAVYTTLSALISRLGRQYSLVPPRAILWFFITSDIIATITQVAGAALIGVRKSDNENATTANNILLGGLAYQVFSMGVFVVLAGSFLFRARIAIRATASTMFTVVFYVTAVLIYLRTAFRLAETAQGLMGELQTHEVYFACLEFAPVALAVLLFAVWHPGRCVGSKVNREQDKESGAV